MDTEFTMKNILILWTLWAAVSGRPAEGPCRPRACLGVWEPVCGSDGRTYGNTCELEVENCWNHKNVTVEQTGECTPIIIIPQVRCRDIVCTSRWDPVCGSDGRTYGNSCELDADNCWKEKNTTIKQKGACPDPKERCRNMACVGVRDPVCASNGRTYGNACELEVENCWKEKNATVAYKGSCPDTTVRCRNLSCVGFWDPVCGSDGRTYGNSCELEAENCWNEKNITVVRNGTCPVRQDPKVRCRDMACLGVWEPLCGSNGRTYGNNCELDVENCWSGKNVTIAHKGTCATANSECEEFCPTVYSPVCGTDGQTYTNTCTLNREKCLWNLDILPAYEGEC